MHKFHPNVESFLSDVFAFPADKCLIWPGALGDGQEPRSYSPDEQESRYPRRELCERVHGQPENGQVVLSTCGDPRCVNPHHLLWGLIREEDRTTRLQNIQEGIEGSAEKCVLWRGHLNKDGYGRFNIERRGRLQMVHRYVCEKVHGPVPFPRAEVLHSCDNPACINSQHLKWGSHQENMKEALERGLYLRGQDTPGSKLKDEDVIEMHALKAQGWTNKKIASKFGVDSSSVSRIVRGLDWAHLYPTR